MSDPEPKKDAVAEEEVVLAAVDSSDSAGQDDDKKRAVLTHQADEYPMRYISFMLFGKELNLNPLTSFFGFAFLWALSIWCMVIPDRKYQVVSSLACLVWLTPRNSR